MRMQEEGPIQRHMRLSFNLSPEARKAILIVHDTVSAAKAISENHGLQAGLADLTALARLILDREDALRQAQAELDGA